MWENRYFPSAKRRTRKVIVAAIMVGILALNFLFMFMCESKMEYILEKFPEQDCAHVEENYKGRMNEFG